MSNKSMHKTGIPYLDCGWNPCGCGCSYDCPGCWARLKVAHRVGENIGCDDCRNFRVHFHPERLDQPARRKKPAVVGVQFTGDLFDAARGTEEIFSVLEHADEADQHTYVFLSQQYQHAQTCLSNFLGNRTIPDNWWIGFTVKTQLQMKMVADVLPAIGRGWNWLSLEPLQELVTLSQFTKYFGEYYSAVDFIDGVVIGCDNRTGTPFDMAWYERIADECSGYGIKLYVKQLQINGKCTTDIEKFPQRLRIRELPWDAELNKNTVKGGENNVAVQ